MPPAALSVIPGLTGNPELTWIPVPDQVEDKLSRGQAWIPAFAGMTVAIRDFQHPVRVEFDGRAGR